MNSPDFTSEQQYDHYDSQGIFDAATIREKSGYETEGSNEDFTAEAIAARVGSVALDGFSHDQDVPQFDGINQKGGLNHVAYAKHSSEEKAITQRGVELARAEMRKNKG